MVKGMRQSKKKSVLEIVFIVQGSGDGRDGMDLKETWKNELKEVGDVAQK